MHNLAVEIERLQSALSDRERELEEIAARGDAGHAGETGCTAAAAVPAQLKASSRAGSPSMRSSCSSCAPGSRTSSIASSPICARAS